MAYKDANQVHPYIPNTVPEVQEEMLKDIGVDSLDDLFKAIPNELKYNKKLNIPDALTEIELKKDIDRTMAKNISTDDVISFLGGGVWEHYIPAVCDEVNQRAEFLTAYAGDEYEDHGRFQALFEYQSLVAELVDMDVVNVPTFDWAQAAATSIRMASRIKERYEVLIPKTISPERLRIINNYCSPDVKCVLVDYNKKTGQLNLDDLKEKISNKTAAVYFENPSFLGFIEKYSKEISEIAKQNGAISIVGVDPSSLGVLEPPVNYGADIVCGELQPLGIRMNYGGGLSGFIATKDEIEFVQEFPSRLFGISPTSKEGEYGFGDVLFDRTSLISREKGKESVGTQTSMWGLTAGVYLALMGPKGMEELGQSIMQRSQYAMKELESIEGVTASRFGDMNFKEFVVDFNDTGKKVKEINKVLREEGIFGGIDLSKDFPELGQCALYCVTEVHSQSDIDKLVSAINNIKEQK